MNAEANKIESADYHRVVDRLVARLIELEAEQEQAQRPGDAMRGVRTNQLDARGNRGGIWYVVESKWSVIAFGVACVALGVSIMTAATIVERLVTTSRELGTERRLQTAAIDELRMENRAVLRAAGIDSEALENHDISQLAEKAVKGKKP